MRRQSPTLFILLLFAVLTLSLPTLSAAQNPSDYSGGSSLVVSRASDPTPSSLTAPSSIFGSVSVVSRQWIEIALASARFWASSFAPAPARHAPVTVRRRAVR
jgi:hypothetical protein